MLAGFLGSGVSNVTMAVALKPITEDLGWSRTLTSSAITIGSVAGGLLAPLIGPLADRLGPRILLPVGAALVGTFVMCLSLTYEPWQFYATFVPARGLAETLLTGVVPMTAVTNWFYSKRPRAIGLVALSVPLGSFVLSLLYQFMIATYGWRSAFMMLGVALWLFVVLPGLFFLRRQPEDMGVLPDGALPLAVKSPQADPQSEPPTAAHRAELDVERCHAHPNALAPGRGCQLLFAFHRRHRFSHGGLFYGHDYSARASRRGAERHGLNRSIR